MSRRRWSHLTTDRFDETDIYVYAYTAQDGEVLYVGRTYDPETRNGAHRQRSPWWSPDLTFAVVDVCRGWQAAVEREARAIRSLTPTFNVAHNSRKSA